MRMMPMPFPLLLFRSLGPWSVIVAWLFGVLGPLALAGGLTYATWLARADHRRERRRQQGTPASNGHTDETPVEIGDAPPPWSPKVP